MVDTIFKVRQEEAVAKLLATATKYIPNIIEALWHISDEFDSYCDLTPRMLHIQNILMLQQRKPSQSASSREKILLLCACKSLAQDFYEFEKRGGWKPKLDQVAARILRGEEPCIQTIGKHLKHYVAAQTCGFLTQYDNLDAAIRFGMKLQVVDVVEESLGFGSCLSLLLGFECAKLTRLSDNSLESLRKTLRTDEPLRKTVVYLNNALRDRWSACQRKYCSRFGDFAPESTNQSPILPTPAVEFGQRVLLGHHEAMSESPSRHSIITPQSIHRDRPAYETNDGPNDIFEELVSPKVSRSFKLR